MLAGIQEKLLTLLLPIILGPMVTGLTQLSKRWVAWLDGQHAIVKQIVAAGWTLVLAGGAAAVGKSLCVDGSQVCDATQLDWRVIVTFAVSLAVHGWKTKPKR